MGNDTVVRQIETIWGGDFDALGRHSSNVLDLLDRPGGAAVRESVG